MDVRIHSTGHIKTQEYSTLWWLTKPCRAKNLVYSHLRPNIAFGVAPAKFWHKKVAFKCLVHLQELNFCGFKSLPKLPDALGNWSICNNLTCIGAKNLGKFTTYFWIAQPLRLPFCTKAQYIAFKLRGACFSENPRHPMQELEGNYKASGSIEVTQGTRTLQLQRFGELAPKIRLAKYFENSGCGRM